jgi:dihydroxyacid dehydratase/phosphogluconate dehydratase
VGGPIALVQDGDPIEIDIPGRTLNILVSELELERRRAIWQPVPAPQPAGFLALYRQMVSQADQGAILKPYLSQEQRRIQP